MSLIHQLASKNEMQNKKPAEDVLSWVYIGTSIYLGFQALKKRDELLQHLESDPLNPQTHQKFLAGLNKIKGLGEVDTAPVYRKVLEILMAHPQNPQLMDLVFKSGQWYFSTQEPAKTYTSNHLSQVKALLAKKKKLKI